MSMVLKQLTDFLAENGLQPIDHAAGMVPSLDDVAQVERAADRAVSLGEPVVLRQPDDGLERADVGVQVGEHERAALHRGT
jgi:hypothetical protein